MRPEMPFLAAGAVSIAGGAIAEKKWPKNTARSIIGTVVLVVVASATANTRVAPLVNAIGLLFLLASVISAVKAAQDSKGKK